MPKVLKIEYQKCTGCRMCELVCSVKHEQVSNPSRSRIKIMKWEAEGLYVPMSCQQCEDAPCMNACPVKALYRNEELNTVAVDYDVCIGCRTCVSVCPFGAMNFDVISKRVSKCDHCDGDPQCVRFCDMKAVDYVNADTVSVSKKRDAAKKISTAQKEGAAMYPPS